MTNSSVSNLDQPPAHPPTPGWIALADGTRFPGTLFGALNPSILEAGGVQSVGEAVFTTGMTGYQEVLTDPSYCDQIVTMTAPQIGNTGINGVDNEASRSHVSGFVLTEPSPRVSHWQSDQSLHSYLVNQGVAAIGGVDTRALTLHIRTHGAQMAVLGTGDFDTLVDHARGAPSMEGRDLTGKVTCKEVHAWAEGTQGWWDGVDAIKGLQGAQPHVVVIDFGIKQNILRRLVDHGCRVTVVPSTTSSADILAHRPDGVFLSNGPGDPAAVSQGVKTVQELLGKQPLFGICLGHQLLCLALGAQTSKLKFGHRGINQPVRDEATGRIEVTSQNHGFVVDVPSLPSGVQMTHVHLNDGTCEGIAHPESQAFSVQYHPESSAGPHDSGYLFQRFVDAMTGQSVK